MRTVSRLAGRMVCLWRGHSRHVAFRYRYWDGPPALIDETVTAHCIRCWATLPCSASGGVVTMGSYRAERAS